MTRTIFTQTLKEQRRGLIGWSIALFAVPMMYVPGYSTFAEQGVLDIEGGGIYDAMGLSDFASAAGYLNSTMYTLLGPMLLLIMAISFGSRSAAQEESGTLDLILAQPVGRTALIAQRFAALAVQVLVATAVFGVAILIGAASGDLGVPAGNILAATAALGLLALAFGALSQLAGAATGKRGVAIAAAAVLAVVAYFANNLAVMSADTERLRYASPFYYVTGGSPLTDGWQVGDLAVLTAIPLATTVVALACFNRRDLAV
ncbi:ABC transporter permease subunit [Glycomyces tenuis]|uniref:ABC transporter permease subunit n=1 Tax=Glycomyces tenuis TaxID=58116 RepID=UPI0003F78810|nr:ABC transporter permease subunit [Glycomyces tenuis]